MRGRRSSRSAAVVLAGCVGLAVMAPGLALAAPLPGTTEAECTSDLGTWDPTTERCAALTAATSTPGDGGTGEEPDATGSTPTRQAPSSATTTPDSTAGTDDTPGSVPVTTAPEVGTDETPTTGSDLTDSADPTAPDLTDSVDPTDPTAPTVTDGGVQPGQDARERTEDGAARLLDAVDEATGTEGAPTALPQEALDALEEALGFTVPTTVPEGGFQSPRESCAYLVGRLQVPSALDAVGLAGQLGGVCAALPSAYSDADQLAGLVDELARILSRYCAHQDLGGAPIPHEPPRTVPVQWWGYWHHGYDVDCPELTYDEANAILDADPSDPFRLDRDDDGEACEANAHGETDGGGTGRVEYVGYPVGGVATGDGSTAGGTGDGAPGVEVALAAGALGGLGVTGLVLVRRFARQG